MPWREGPHDGFSNADPGQLASDSLRWFEESAEASDWRGNETAILELRYSSGDVDVTTRRSGASVGEWERQIRAWLRRFPLGCWGRDGSEGSFSWKVEFADSGRIDGDADSDSGAVEAMRTVIQGVRPALAMDEPRCTLGIGIRRSSHSMDCYFVDAQAARIQDLPRLLKEKRVQNGGF